MKLAETHRELRSGAYRRLLAGMDDAQGMLWPRDP